MPRSSFGATFFNRVAFVLEAVLWFQADMTGFAGVTPEQTGDRLPWQSQHHPHPDKLDIEIRTTLPALMSVVEQFGQRDRRFPALFVAEETSAAEEKNRDRLRAVLYRLQELGYLQKMLAPSAQIWHLRLSLTQLSTLDECRAWLDRTLPRDWERLRVHRSAYSGSARNSCPSPHPLDMPPSRALGRQQERDRIHSAFRQNVHLLAICGAPGIGKTTLAAEVLDQLPFEARYNITPKPDPFLRDWIDQQLGRSKLPLDKWNAYVRCKAVSLKVEGFEACLDAEGKLLPAYADWLEFMQSLRLARGLSLVTSDRRIADGKLTSRSLILTGLSIADWQTDWKARGIELGDRVLPAIHRAYGGHPKAMRIIGNEIAERFEGYAETFWQWRSRDLLFDPQLRHLYLEPLRALRDEMGASFQVLARTLLASGDCESCDRAALEQLESRFLVQSHLATYRILPVMLEAIALLTQSNPSPARETPEAPS
ncbi:MAG: hypothetical protein AAFX40_11950 [Cyanobacteria bacterium J06639_1]